MNSKRISKILVVAGLSVMGFIAPAGVHAHASNVNNNKPEVLTPKKQTNQKPTMQIKTPNNNPQQHNKLNKVEKIAKSKLGDRYCWGATGPKRFDCSGFTQYVFKHALHKHLPRIAGAQYYDFKHVNKNNRKAGDLVFFGSSKRSITHVGLYLGHGKMIDAQNRGVIIEHVHAPWWHAVGYSRPAKF